jgi:hypothetical protein
MESTNLEQANAKPCQICGQMMYAEARNVAVFWMKQQCCYHCGATYGREHSHYCSLVEGLRNREIKQVYVPGEDFISIDLAISREPLAGH